MGKNKVMYVIETDAPYGKSEFLKSIYCGEGYATKRDALAHVKFLQKTYKNEHLTVGREEAPAGW